MTQTQRKFVALEKMRVDWKQYLVELDEMTQAVANEIGIGSYFGDDEGVVYKVVVPGGRWVAYETIGYVRTKRGDEAKGSLSAKEAKEAGYEV